MSTSRHNYNTPSEIVRQNCPQGRPTKSNHSAKSGNTEIKEAVKIDSHLKILSLRAIEGPNIFSHQPVIVMSLDLGECGEVRTCDVEGFDERLLALLPGLRDHCCSLGRKGGFLHKLVRGTYLGHVVEHVALETQVLAGFDVSFGRTLDTEALGIYTIVYEYKAKQAAIYLGQKAVHLVEVALSGHLFDVNETVEGAKRIAAATELGPSTAAIVREARARGIPSVRLNDKSLVQLGYGKHRKIIEASVAHNTRAVGVDIAQDKILAKQILENEGIPVPSGSVAKAIEEAVTIAKDLGYPVVVKPVDGNQGRGVALNLRSASEVRKAYSVASRYSREVLVEQHIPGKHYRLLVIGDEVVASSERVPAHVIGDGVHDIQELVKIENASDLRGDGHEKPLTKIRIDPVVWAVLAKQKISLKSIPSLGEVVFLRENANLSTGGIAYDVTELVHPDNSLVALRSAQIIGLDIAGVDIVTSDISMSMLEYPAQGSVIEVNACPGLRMHLFPSRGKSRPVAAAILDTMFPQGTDGRIPIVSVTGTNGKTTVVRLITQMFMNAGLKPGLTSTDGVFIDGRKILAADASGPRSAKMVLGDPAVEATVFEVARGGIIRDGIGFDECDVAVVTNIQGDHVGQDGVRTLEDLIQVKSLVVEAVKKSGYAVLNADDPATPLLSERCKGGLVYFSLRPNNIRVRRHVLRKGMAIYVKDGAIFVARSRGTPDSSCKAGKDTCSSLFGKGRKDERRKKKEGEGELASLSHEYVCAIEDMPVSFGGKARFNIENALAATGAGMAAGLPIEVISKTLREFRSDERDNPGRFNVLMKVSTKERRE